MPNLIPAMDFESVELLFVAYLGMNLVRKRETQQTCKQTAKQFPRRRRVTHHTIINLQSRDHFFFRSCCIEINRFRLVGLVELFRVLYIGKRTFSAGLVGQLFQPASNWVETVEKALVATAVATAVVFTGANSCYLHDYLCNLYCSRYAPCKQERWCSRSLSSDSFFASKASERTKETTARAR